ncbi:MAG: hypothetical protein M0Z73_02570 [Betaproteobacteria bacterium]|nr:hypothetical protein [Betaproteobacteria bacterium]
MTIATYTLTEAEIMEAIEKMDEDTLLEIGMVGRIATMSNEEIGAFITDLENNNACGTPRIVEAVRNRLYTLRAELVAQLPDELKPKVH